MNNPENDLTPEQIAEEALNDPPASSSEDVSIPPASSNEEEEENDVSVLEEEEENDVSVPEEEEENVSVPPASSNEEEETNLPTPLSLQNQILHFFGFSKKNGSQQTLINQGAVRNNSAPMNSTYDTYLEYLKQYFERPSKKSIYKKSFENGKLVLTGIKDPSKKIIITPSVMVDLSTYKTYLDKEIHNILFRILRIIENYQITIDEQRQLFEKEKKSYVIYKKQLNDIERLENDFYQKVEKIQDDIANLAIQLNIIRNDRQNIYHQINTPITNGMKTMMMKSFQENSFKKPSSDKLSLFSKELNIPIDQIDLWFDWFEKSYLYINAEKEYSLNIKKQLDLENAFQHQFKNYIFVPPSFEKK